MTRTNDTTAVLFRLACHAAAEAIEGIGWEGLPGLSEREWTQVSAHLDVLFGLLCLAAGREGYDAYYEALR